MLVVHINSPIVQKYSGGRTYHRNVSSKADMSLWQAGECRLIPQCLLWQFLHNQMRVCGILTARYACTNRCPQRMTGVFACGLSLFGKQRHYVNLAMASLIKCVNHLLGIPVSLYQTQEEANISTLKHNTKKLMFSTLS